MNKYRGFTIIELLVVISVFLIMIALLTPFVKMTQDRAYKINCANNLRQISLGLHSYAIDHNEAFPPQLGYLYPNYINNEKAFDCPAAKTVGTKDNPDYIYKGGLTESSSAKEIIIEDRDGNHGKSGKNILRINGSVEWTGSGW